MKQLNLSNIPQTRPAQLSTVGQLLIQQIGEHIQLALTQDANWVFGGTFTVQSIGGVVYVDGTLSVDDTAIDPVESTPAYDIGAFAVASDARITVLAFRSRFTQAEKIGIELASIDNPQATSEARAMAAALRVQMADLSVARYVDLNRPDTRAGVQTMESVGLIAPGRASQILSTEIDPLEAP